MSSRRSAHSVALPVRPFASAAAACSSIISRIRRRRRLAPRPTGRRPFGRGPGELLGHERLEDLVDQGAAVQGRQLEDPLRRVLDRHVEDVAEEVAERALDPGPGGASATPARPSPVTAPHPAPRPTLPSQRVTDDAGAGRAASIPTATGVPATTGCALASPPAATAAATTPSSRSAAPAAVLAVA